MASRASASDMTGPEESLREHDAQPQQLIIASNRGPVTFSYPDDGTFTSRKGSGGVVTAVSAIARDRQPIWIAAAMTDGDRQRARQSPDERGEGLISPPGPELRFPGSLRRSDTRGLSPVLQRDQQSLALVSPALSLGHSELARYHGGDLGRLATAT